MAVGVIRSADEKVLLAQRQSGQHLAGFWEFPGGKLEKGESGLEALQRELKEELGIDVDSAEYLFDIEYDYPEKAVKLINYIVDDFEGEPVGAENQRLKWVDKKDLRNYKLPPANVAIVEYLEGET